MQPGLTHLLDHQVHLLLIKRTLHNTHAHKTSQRAALATALQSCGSVHAAISNRRRAALAAGYRSDCALGEHPQTPARSARGRGVPCPPRKERAADRSGWGRGGQGTYVALAELVHPRVSPPTLAARLCGGVLAPGFLAPACPPGPFPLRALIAGNRREPLPLFSSGGLGSIKSPKKALQDLRAAYCTLPPSLRRAPSSPAPARRPPRRPATLAALLWLRAPAVLPTCACGTPDAASRPVWRARAWVRPQGKYRRPSAARAASHRARRRRELEVV